MQRLCKTLISGLTQGIVEGRPRQPDFGPRCRVFNRLREPVIKQLTDESRQQR